MSMEADKAFVLEHEFEAQLGAMELSDDSVVFGIFRGQPYYRMISKGWWTTRAEAWASAAALLKQNEQSGQPGETKQ